MLNIKEAAIGSAAAVILVATFGTAGPAQAADDAEATFHEFADSLSLDPTAEAALQIRFESLNPQDQSHLLAALSTDPGSAFEVSESSQPAVAESDDRSVANLERSAVATKSYLAKDSQTVSMLGIPVHTLTLEFKYSATTASVTKILSCDGWHAGAGLADSPSRSSYISSGRGTCSVVHHMSFLFKGSPITFNKQHIITTNSGRPSAYVATIRTV